MVATADVRGLAARMARSLVTKKRDNGAPYVTLGPAAPEWMAVVCRKAHDDGQLAPDDWRYQFIRDAVDAIAAAPTPDEADEYLDIDAYASRPHVIDWYSSHPFRASYADDALRNGCDTIFSALVVGMWTERTEVLHQVLEALRAVQP